MSDVISMHLLGWMILRLQEVPDPKKGWNEFDAVRQRTDPRRSVVVWRDDLPKLVVLRSNGIELRLFAVDRVAIPHRAFFRRFASGGQSQKRSEKRMACFNVTYVLCFYFVKKCCSASFEFGIRERRNWIVCKAGLIELLAFWHWACLDGWDDLLSVMFNVDSYSAFMPRNFWSISMTCCAKLKATYY